MSLGADGHRAELPICSVRRTSSRYGSRSDDHGVSRQATMHPSWSEQWWPVAYLRDLDQTRPQRFTLLEQDLVLWWDAPGESWRAFEDVCPHR